MIATLLITIFAEGVIISGYALWRKKSIIPLLLTSTFANGITQSLLWIVLSLFFQHYLLSLAVAEILIWMIESIMLYSIPPNRLGLTEAFILSLSMNVASFAVGWFLPV
ncbi:MAG TPA: hypothetical protein VGK56_15280 [Anaerolineales bacterium]